MFTQRRRAVQQLSLAAEQRLNTIEYTHILCLYNGSLNFQTECYPAAITSMEAASQKTFSPKSHLLSFVAQYAGT